MVFDEDGSRSPSIERGRGGAHDLSDDHDSIGGAEDNGEEGGRTSGDDEGQANIPEGGQDSVQGGDGKGSRGGGSREGLDCTIDDDDQPLSYGLEEGPFNKQCHPSIDKGDIALDRYLDPTLPFPTRLPDSTATYQIEESQSLRCSRTSRIQRVIPSPSRRASEPSVPTRPDFDGKQRAEEVSRRRYGANATSNLQEQEAVQGPSKEC